MQDCSPHLHLSSLYIDRNALLAQIVHLQEQIVERQVELVDLVLSKHYTSEQERIKALHDETFGCRVEIQSLRVQVSKLNAQIDALQTAPNQ